MPPKFDPTEVQVVYVRVMGGEVPAASALAPKVGPLGLSPKKVGDDLVKATQEWKGLRVTAKLTIQNRQAKAEVVPSASALVIKALKEPTRDRKKVKNSECRTPDPVPGVLQSTCGTRHAITRVNASAPCVVRVVTIFPQSHLTSVPAPAVVHSGSISMDDVIRIARIMRPKSLAKKFEGTVLEILGTAQSTGCQVDGQDPHDIIDAIHNGEGPEIPEE